MLRTYCGSKWEQSRQLSELRRRSFAAEEREMTVMVEAKVLLGNVRVCLTAEKLVELCDRVNWEQK